MYIVIKGVCSVSCNNNSPFSLFATSLFGDCFLLFFVLFSFILCTCASAIGERSVYVAATSFHEQCVASAA
ncbi:hypothetical protein ABB37_03826 [Leptomonas pyrrhocoris]|uniref:Uncharacterized protein n=1 Tax=Leptomonas pyrrhocoris TaxID=157538 RepID=A0A0M9G3L7_LEPPY|nr:hypothetical protein ABB37_03826 [Leptomonas pyrrhocoris]KPA81469.1 hypothetical protein ABB37_03826 [Leptomonas pyrrhocoris]|eukprot:XP_015659908.1 hypothetical protein ABB37_03826 [Leptomonas pyrrhocoris]